MVAARQPRKAVVLARGLGTRMRADDAGAQLDAEQASVAATGLKAMIPVGRPFLDYLLSSIADAGFTEVCIVIGPEHSSVRDYYHRDTKVSRVALTFAEQAQPLGTADAVLAAESFVEDDSFIVLNSDNYYPARALEELRRASPPALIGFEQRGLVEKGNVPADRVQRFGALEIDAEGCLVRIRAATDPNIDRSEAVYASMNCWSFTPVIFRACREIAVSPRGELELPRAVQLAIDQYGARFKVIRLNEPVLDMSSRADIAGVAEHLMAIGVSL